MPNVSQICPLSKEELTIDNTNEFILVKSRDAGAEQASYTYYFIQTSAQNLFFGLDKCPITKSTEEYQALYLKDLSAELKGRVLGLTDTAEFNLFFKNKGLQNYIKTGSFTFITVVTNPTTTLEEFKNLITTYPLQMNAIINTVNKDTLLHYFTIKNKAEFVEVLVKAVVSINNTNIHTAAQKGHTETVQALIKAGAKIEAKDNQGKTPLHAAAAEGHTETALALIAANADINAKSCYGLKPLHMAAKNGKTETLLALIEKGANIEPKDCEDWTPLHWAAKNGKTETVQALIDAGSNKEAKDNYSKTPLHCAALLGHTETVIALVEQGAKIEAKDFCGCTPLHCAAQNGQTETVQALIKAGADIEAKDNQGKAPLRLAANNKHADIVKILAEKAKTLNITSVTSSSIFQPKALQSDDNSSGQGNDDTAKADSKPLI